MKTNELRSKTIEELQRELLAQQKALIELQLKKNLGGDNRETGTHKFGLARRQIARIKTVLNEKKRSS